MQQGLKRLIAVAVVLAVLVGGIAFAPQEAQAAWCSTGASWAGQNGWQGLNPNFEVWFPLDTGAHAPYYIYFNSNYVGPEYLAPHGLYDGTTRFGVDTTWALSHWGWNNASNWRIDYTC